MPEAIKTAILFAVAGTTCTEAESAFENITAHAETRFPGTAVYWAYTSEVVRQRLSKRGREIDSPIQALERIGKSDCTHLVVHPLHTVAGKEYEDLKVAVDTFRGSNSSVVSIHVGEPLLCHHDEFVRTVRILLSEACPDMDVDEALVLMAHGTRNADQAKKLETAADWCRTLKARVFMGTLMRPPVIEDVIAHCESEGIRKAHLAPFMIVAGYTAINELTDRKDDSGNSWHHKLSEAGIECRPAVKGLGEYDSIVEIWLDRIQATLTTWTM